MILRSRSIAAVTLVAAVVLSSGCSWFKGKPDAYLDSPQSRPLDVPPDLVLPSTSAALQVPGVVSGTPGVMAAPPAAATIAGFALAEGMDGAFRRVGIALPRIEGVTAKPVQALNSFEVQYQGSDFLVKLAPDGQQTQVSAVAPDGSPVTSGPAAALLAALQARLQ